VAWTDSTTIMLRYIIGDVNVPQAYSDSRLQQTLAIAAMFVDSEMNFSQPFVVDPVAITITPDPSIAPTIDDWFTNLMVIKATQIILESELKALTAGALMFREFNSIVDRREGAKWLAQLLKDKIAEYSDARMRYQCAVRPSIASIIGPFNILAGNFRGPVYPYTQRDRLFI
jgi:hypothetical protein